MTEIGGFIRGLCNDNAVDVQRQNRNTVHSKASDSVKSMKHYMETKERSQH